MSYLQRWRNCTAEVQALAESSSSDENDDIALDDSLHNNIEAGFLPLIFESDRESISAVSEASLLSDAETIELKE